MATPNKYAKLDANKLFVRNLGCFDCDLTVKKDLIVKNNLIVEGNIEGMGNLDMSMLTGLIGFWNLWPANSSGDSPGSNLAMYDCITGTQSGLTSNFVIGDGPNQGKTQYNQGRDTNSLIYSYTNGGEFIASFNTTTGVITYLAITPASDPEAFIYDKVGDRYLCFNSNDGSLMAYDPILGNESDLTGGSAATVINKASDGFIINDTVFFNSLQLVLADPNFMVSFNRATGAYNGGITWTGSFIYSGTQFKDLSVNDIIFGCGLDEANSTVYFLIGGMLKRYIGSVSANNLSSLEALLLSGAFDITILTSTPTSPLHALAFINS